MSQHGEIEDPVGTRVRRGRGEIEQYFAGGLCAVAAEIEIEIVAALPAGDSIAAHWRMTARAGNGRRADAEGIDVLEVDDGGFIRRVEGYWDQQAFRHAIASPRARPADAALCGASANAQRTGWSDRPGRRDHA
jgi:hypothetical protein